MEGDVASLGPFLEGVKESSSRVRTITVVATTLCLIILAACWNQEPFSWFHGKEERFRALTTWFQLEATVLKDADVRIKDKRAKSVFTKVEHYDSCISSLSTKLNELAHSPMGLAFLVDDKTFFFTPAAVVTHPELIRQTSSCIGFLQKVKNVSWEDKGGTPVCTGCPPRALEYYYQRIDGRDFNQIQKDAAYFHNQLIEMTEVVGIAALGIRFHVNDIGTIGCFALFIVMIWLRLSLWRHLSNINQTFRKALELQQMGVAYRLMAMHQIMTLPPLDSDPMRGRPFFWSGVVVYSLPLFAVSAVLATDLFTLERAIQTYPRMPYISLGATSTFVCLVAWSTIACLGLQIEILSVWRDHRLLAAPQK